MYLIEQESLRDATREDRWALRRRLAERLLDRARGVPRRMRHLLQRRFVAAWAWVGETDSMALVEETLLRGGLDRRTTAGSRDGAQEHLGFFLDLSRGTPWPDAVSKGQGTPPDAPGTRRRDVLVAAPAISRPRRSASADWPTLFPVGITEGA